MKRKKSEGNENSQCECGCGEITNGGRFRPGHDAKLKSRLIKEALAGGKRAAAKLEALGWTRFLETKRRLLAQKEAKAAKRKATAGEKVAAPPEETGEHEEVSELANEPQAGVHPPKRRGRPRKVRPEATVTSQE